MITLHIINRQRKVRLSLPLLGKIADLAVPHCLARTGDGEAVLATLTEIEVTLVSDRVISLIHKRFFNDPLPTDVITFPHGEIIISAETAAANAQKYDHSVTREIGLCIIHGLLHLNGYDDQLPSQALKIAKRQNAILEAVSHKL